ncbi:MAG: glyceraldehyde-3-phosphate dehydrogenase [Acidobacteria bacterium]|nr:glyceraldehyde-3-phosphate dehydrogenase [Acidobacteriota bacterium]
MSEELYREHLQDWKEREELAEASLPLIGRLYRDHGVVTLIYGQPVIKRGPMHILKAHRYVRRVENSELSIRDSFPLLEAMSRLPLSPARIDWGRLAVLWLREGKKESPDAFVARELAGCIEGRPALPEKPQDVVLFGFGRIGRLVTRLLVERMGTGEILRLRAIAVRKQEEGDIHKRASLLRRDSVHGLFNGTIQIDEANQALIVNGNFIKMIYADAPEKADYASCGITNAIVIDNTGKWRDEEGLGRHLRAPGAAKVLLTAPGKGAIKNVVFGVNEGTIGDDDRILSAASCTTNAIVPVLKAIHDKFGVESGHVETVHAYTNDQNLIDNYHKKTRRGRGAPLNMVITETGAAKAVAKAIPELAGKLTGNAIRVPVPNVSLAILHLNLAADVTVESVNEHLRFMALYSSMQKQIDYSASTEIASTDIIGSRRAGVVDSMATIASGRRTVLYVWYDNEFGYSAQVVRVVHKMAGIRYPLYPQPA